MQKKPKIYELPFFFLLTGIYPILSLLGNNISEIHPSAGIRPFLFSLALTILLFLVSLAVFRNIYKAAAVTAVALILFFAYGHLVNLTGQAKIAGIAIGRRRYLVAFEAALLLLALFLIARSRSSLKSLSVILNTVAVALLLFPLYQIIDFNIRSAAAHNRQSVRTVSAQASGEAVKNNHYPDIYYIILDMYTRDDVLKQLYGVDNRPFLDQLSQLGFYVARCAQSNYSQTQLSLASSLNMDYLPALGNFPPESGDRTALDELIEHSAVRKFLEPLGYQTVSMSEYDPLKIESAAIYISTDPQDLPNASSVPLITPFEAMFIKNSALQILTGLPQAKQFALIRDINYPYATHIRQQLFILDRLKQIPDIPGPKFVFVHVQIPHPPMVFGPDGEIVDNPPPFPSDPANPVPIERVNRLYGDQVLYVNKRILDDVTTIIQKSQEPPVIILQGDHGANVDIRMPVLNAILVPQDQRKDFYPQISPVNSFRYILDHLFGASYGLLPDVANDSTYGSPFVYIPRIDSREGCSTHP